MGFSSVNEKDWKMFRNLLPKWQERYMESLVNEYMGILGSDDNASDKFWKLEEQMKEDRKEAGVVCEIGRSKMHSNIYELLDEGAITMDDLDGFSEELKEMARSHVQWMSS